jgi:hypothetical protein
MQATKDSLFPLSLFFLYSTTLDHVQEGMLGLENGIWGERRLGLPVFQLHQAPRILWSPLDGWSRVQRHLGIVDGRWENEATSVRCAWTWMRERERGREGRRWAGISHSAHPAVARARWGADEIGSGVGDNCGIMEFIPMGEGVFLEWISPDVLTRYLFMEYVQPNVF